MLSGPDGVGKTTIAMELCKHYQANGVQVEVVWLRFHHYFQSAINLFGRFLGKSYDEEYAWGKDNYHDYTGVFGFFYILAAFVDHVLFKVIKERYIFRNDNLFVVDRFIIDVVADLIVDTENPKLVFLIFDKAIRKELKRFKVFIIECDFDIVVSRRKDIQDDKKYLKKIAVYKVLADKYCVETIDTGINSIRDSIEKITKK